MKGQLKACREYFGRMFPQDALLFPHAQVRVSCHVARQTDKTSRSVYINSENQSLSDRHTSRNRL